MTPEQSQRYGRLVQAITAQGFCVELAVNGARSFAVRLWPLHSIHSPEFANQVAGDYLRLRGEGMREGICAYEALSRSSPALREDGNRRSYMIAACLSESNLRARAVASARWQWLADHRAGRRRIGLNTAAAFELYGIG